MKFYDNIEGERDRIQACINKYGWTSDHNLYWFIDASRGEGRPVFCEFNDNSGILAIDCDKEWWIWSDPLSNKKYFVDRISELSNHIFKNGVKKIWCVDVSDTIKPTLAKKNGLIVNDTDYSLLWPVLDMSKYDLDLPGGHFKEMRNARNKFYREHKIEVVNPTKIKNELLHNIVRNWKKRIESKENIEDIHDSKYSNAIENGFRAFLTARVLVVDEKPVGINAGYEVINCPRRFAGIVGIHDYSLSDLGTILWLEDLDWIKNHNYKELDMQGSEDDGGLKLKLRFGAKVERKTDTFLIKNR